MIFNPMRFAMAKDILVPVVENVEGTVFLIYKSFQLIQQFVAEVLALVDNDVGIGPFVVLIICDKKFFKSRDDLVNGQALIFHYLFCQGTHIVVGDERVMIVLTNIGQEKLVVAKVKDAFAIFCQHLGLLQS